MQIRRIGIENFKGIESLDFRIPAGKRFVCLIGPGDSAKSTILEAVHLALGERWSLSLSDTDFLNANVDRPIEIRVAVADLPDDILSHAVLGMQLSGIMGDGEWQHDPTDDCDPCVIVQLRIDKDMEPQWTVFRPGGAEVVPVGSGLRRKFSVFKIDDRIDNHLRWTRTSALTRLTDASHGTAGTLAASFIAAREAVSSATTPELNELTRTIGSEMRKLGSSEFTDLKPGLDTSLSTAGGNLALFEGVVPLTNFGLGTRRLAGVATQGMASANKAVLLIDEVEYGLEPHRLVHLLDELKSDDGRTQVFATTHSPVAVEQLSASDLVIVRCLAGATTAEFVPNSMNEAQAGLRSRPSAFLARKVVVTEGKTEHGLLLGAIDLWDEAAKRRGDAVCAALGVTIMDGQGGSTAPERASVLAKLGYDVILFVDNDDRSIDTAVDQATADGAQVARWSVGHATEDELIAELTAAQITSLVQLAVDFRADSTTVRSDLLNCCTGPRVSNLDVAIWISTDGFTLETARGLVAEAARKSKWFKTIDGGRALADFAFAQGLVSSNYSFGGPMGLAREFIYGPEPEEDDGEPSLEDL